MTQKSGGEWAFTYYDPKLTPKPFGLNNTGVICYFNSLLQSLMSIPSFNKKLIENKDRFQQNQLVQKYIHLLQTNMSSASADAPPVPPKPPGAPKYATQNCNDILQSLISMTRKNLVKPDTAKTQFGKGQECADEGLKLFMELMSYDKKQKNEFEPVDIFKTRYRSETICSSCKHKSVAQAEEELFIAGSVDAISPTSADKSLEAKIKQHLAVVNDYKCEKCNKKGAWRSYSLSMLSDVIIVIFHKYFIKKMEEFPMALKFKKKGVNEFLQYKIVAQIEHFGTMMGGHYTARALRHVNGKEQVMLFNDRSVTPSSFKPTKNTFIVFYHIETPKEAKVAEEA